MSARPLHYLALVEDRREPPQLVRVFREHPEWDDTTRWFFMRADLLRELAVAVYEVDPYADLSESHPAIKGIRAQHPGCVLVYAGLS